MRILMITTYAPGDASFFIRQAFEDLGHQADIIRPPKVSFILEGVTLRSRLRHRLINFKLVRNMLIANLEKQVTESIHHSSPDIILMHKGDFIPVKILRRIRSESTATMVNWFPDAIVNLRSPDVFPGIGLYDRFFVKDRYFQKQLEKVGFSNIGYLPQAFDPRVHAPVGVSGSAASRYGCDVCVIGTCYPYRLQLVSHLTDYDLKIWGAGWNMLGPEYASVRSRWQGRSIVMQDKAVAFSACKVVLNTQHYGEVLGVNKRTYEAAGAGAFQLVGKTGLLPGQDGLQEVFEPNEEIVCFENVPDLREKIDYYLAHPDERKAIARRARQRALRDHTYEKRIVQLLKDIE